jgi:hypothetical protein
MPSETYLNIPLAPEVRRELEAQADENARSTGREGALIIDRAMRRRIAKRAESEAKKQA